MKNLQEQYHLTYLFIGHALSVINFIADRVCVMFLGNVCEISPKEALYQKPLADHIPGEKYAVVKEEIYRNRFRLPRMLYSVRS